MSPRFFSFSVVPNPFQFLLKMFNLLVESTPDGTAVDCMYTIQRVRQIKTTCCPAGTEKTSKKKSFNKNYKG